MKKIDQILTKITLGLIKIYQKTVSPDHSPLGKLFPYRGCKFHPTCSMYATEMFKKRGFFKGIGPAFQRFFRCHPWSDGGIDEPKP